DAPPAALGSNALGGRPPGDPAARADPGRRLRGGGPHLPRRGLRPRSSRRPHDRPLHGLPRPAPLRRAGAGADRGHGRGRAPLRDHKATPAPPPCLPRLRAGTRDRRRRAAGDDRPRIPPARLPRGDGPPGAVRTLRGLFSADAL
ncbi:MAG: hypothetical protein AVDCRST_MAG73-999, partial [uncultured Thermomicrobiales bacterium]